MRLSRIIIKNFRNFKSMDVKLGEHAVVLGENKVGKTNLLFALRLILDPSLPDSSRRLRLDDFWDGLPRPLKKEDVIEISVEFRDFENSENLLAVLADHLVKPDPMVARITYRFQPVAGREEAPRSEADYEFVIFGGNRPNNEAQHLSIECLETLRELLDQPPHCGLLFAGTHELEAIFTRQALELEQWRSRFHAGQALPGISEEEAATIVHAELGLGLSQRKIQKLISKSRITDLRNAGQHSYVSARRLFWVIRELQAVADSGTVGGAF
jgi:hypothetical protein